MGEPVDSGPRVMVSIGQIAEQEGISKQAVSKVVAKLVEQGMPVNRDGRGRIATLPLAWWNDHRGSYVNPARQPAKVEPIASAAVRASDSFDEARRQNEWLKVDAARIERQKEMGRLVRADRLADAVDAVGKEIQATVMRLANRADDVAVAVSKEGAHGARMALRDIAVAICADIARKMADIAAASPAKDDMIEEEEA